MFEEKILPLLKDTKKILDKNNIKFWPMYGTLLGFVREKGLISYDYDIDISTWEYDYDQVKNLQSEFEKLGGNIYKRFRIYQKQL